MKPIKETSNFAKVVPTSSIRENKRPAGSVRTSATYLRCNNTLASDMAWMRKEQYNAANIKTYPTRGIAIPFSVASLTTVTTHTKKKK